MKKSISLLLMTFSIMILASCSGRTGGNAELKNGIYILQNDEIGPYVFFDTENMTWRCGAGIAVSNGLGGTYIQTDGRIEAKNKDGTDTVIEFQILSETEIKAITVKEGFFPQGNKWISEGKIYVFKSFGDASNPEALFRTVCSADEALELAKKTDTVVFERRGCTSGNEVWDTFFQTVSSESPASVLCAHYYVLDKEHMSKELYEEEKDQYPKLFFYLVEYDGKEYSVKTRESTVEAIDYQETFKYLLHFTGAAPATALYSTYDNYVLVDDSSATWEGIVAGMVSSQFGAGYKHCTVYRNYFGWAGD